MIESIFSQNYKRGWGKNSCGPGSTPQYTLEYRAFLQGFLKDEHIRSVLDLGCGDWSFSQLIDWSGIDYLGVDILEPIIVQNQRKFGCSNIRFERADVGCYPLGGVDLVLIKDVLQHWPTEQVQTFLTRLDDSSAKMALITNCDHHRPSKDIRMGGFRPLSLNCAPFNRNLEVKFSFHTKSVLLWKNLDASGP